MRKALSLIPLIMAIILFVASVILCFYSVYDINSARNELADNPGASGADYLGVTIAYGASLFILFSLSTLGLILSVISRKILEQRIPRLISIVLIFLFVFIMTTSFFFYFLR